MALIVVPDIFGTKRKTLQTKGHHSFYKIGYFLLKITKIITFINDLLGNFRKGLKMMFFPGIDCVHNIFENNMSKLINWSSLFHQKLRLPFSLLNLYEFLCRIIPGLFLYSQSIKAGVMYLNCFFLVFACCLKYSSKGQ